VALAALKSDQTLSELAQQFGRPPEPDRAVEEPARASPGQRILAWRLSNSMTVGFCIEAVEAAIRDYGIPEIFLLFFKCKAQKLNITGNCFKIGIFMNQCGGMQLGDCRNERICN
jgi:hypothetical protein